MSRARLLVVYHSQRGGRGIEALNALRSGIESESDGRLDLIVKPALEATEHDLIGAQAVIFLTPENFGYMSGALKDFFDRTFYPAQGKVNGVGYALLVVCGNDGRGAVSSVERIVKGYPLKPIQEPLILREADFPAALAQAEELGATVAAMLAFGMF